MKCNKTDKLQIICNKFSLQIKEDIDELSFKCISNISKQIYSLPKNFKASIEIISFINGLLQYYPEKRLNWKQINSHPFLTKKVD